MGLNLKYGTENQLMAVVKCSSYQGCDKTQGDFVYSTSRSYHPGDHAGFKGNGFS